MCKTCKRFRNFRDSAEMVGRYAEVDLPPTFMGQTGAISTAQVMQAMPGPMQAPVDAAPVATGMAMQPMVGGAAPQRMMMQPLQTANGEGVQMMSPVAAVAVIPAGMAMPGTAMNGMGLCLL